MASAHAYHAATTRRMSKAETAPAVTQAPAHTTTMLNRWSVAEKILPSADKIKAIHVYDFDNTLFNSPLPNPRLWNGPTIGNFQRPDVFLAGGWWHDSRILAATGSGVEIETKRGWNGWWNEQIVELINLSMQQEDALTVLLTGRSEIGFAPLIKKMVESRGMEFDMIVLKPKVGPRKEVFANTMAFKQVFLEALMETYKDAEEIRIYEDRVKHVKAFRDFFFAYNRRQNGIGGEPSREPITAEVIQVADGATLLDPVVETAEIQRLVDDHNKAIENGERAFRMAIKKTIFFTGYLISEEDTKRLLALVPPQLGSERDMKYLGNNILICPRPAPPAILEKVGGMGNKQLWEVTGTGHLEDRIWAAQVRPVPHSAPYFVETPTPIVVLAMKGRDTKPYEASRIHDFQPLPADKQFIFETVVGEKVLLRVEEEDKNAGEWEGHNPYPLNKNKRRYDDENLSPRAPTGPSGRGGGGYRGDYGGRGRGGYPSGPRNQNLQGGRGRGGAYGGGRGQGGGRGKMGGGKHYKSLDDMGPESFSRHNGGVQYEDFPSLPSAHQKRQTENQRYQQNDFDDRAYQGGGGGSHRGGGGNRGRGGYGGGGGGGGQGGGLGGGNVGDYY